MTTKPESPIKTYCHPVLDDADARALCNRRAHGTTASGSEYVVIWRGKHLALMRGIGHNTCRHIDLVNQTGSWGSRRVVETVHVPSEDPRLTRKRVGTLIYKAKVRDRQWLEEQRTKEQERAAQDEKRRRLYAAQSKVNETRGLMLEAAMLDDGDLLVQAAANYRAAMRALSEVTP